MKLSRRQINFIRIAVEMVVIFTVIFTVSYFHFHQRLSEVRMFDEGWKVVQDGEVYYDVTLSEYEFPHMMDEGDSVLISNVVPAGINTRSTFSLLVYLSTVDVYLDGQCIYSYGYDQLLKGKMVGSGYHFIQLPDDCVGKEIKIVICSREDNAFSSIPAIEIVPTQSMIASFARQHLMLIFVSLFLIVLGIILMITSLIGVFFKTQAQRLIWIGSFSFLIGVWSMGTTKTLQIFSIDLALNATIEYLSLFLAIIPLLIQMYNLRKDSAPWKKWMLLICIVASIVYVSVATILHFTNTMHYCETLGVFHIIMVISLIIILVAAWKPLKDMNASDRVLNIGFFALFATGGVDLIRFMVQKYLLTNDQNLSNSILPVGALIFIVFLIMSYLFFVYNNILEEENRKTLTRLAYHDTLTGLYNRAKGEEIMKKWSEEDEDYIIINMDLNGLKRINDTYGHSQGDLLLTTFAENLTKAFSDEATIVRIGGDEFVVLAKEKEKNSLEHSLLKLNRLNREVSQELPFTVEVAYGLASSGESGVKDYEKLGRIADQKMYEMKQKMKAQQGFS